MTAGGDGRSRRPNPGITVTGRGVVSVVPDVMHVLIGVAVLRDSVAAARADAASLAEAVTEAITSRGVAERDLKTARFAIWPEYRQTERRRVLDGYRVTSTLNVTVRDMDRAGDAIDAAVAAGGNDVVIENVSFAIEDDAAALGRARALAWSDAEQKGAELAGLAGVSLGSPIRITEVAGAAGPGPMPMARMAVAEMSTPIESGMTDVAVTIEVQFPIVTN